DAETITAAEVLAFLYDALGQATGLLEAGRVTRLEPHAERAINDEDSVRAAPAGCGQHRALGQVLRPEVLGPARDAGHGQQDEQHDKAAHGQEDELFEAKPPRVLLLGREQESHGGPGDDAKAFAVKQVDDDGDRYRSRRRRQHRERTAEEESQGCYLHGIVWWRFGLNGHPRARAIAPTGGDARDRRN